eukprot:TRINITY_DN11309_c0_g1_i1.p1 TRINITY_DN11309_c0_g1~~TRINITY_DN11309_c0_g1_i1.p1  ORF type:complete len:430 (+),score=83.95 TRINITY_DN11309_c0_g1_i1:84-1373(+)
MGDLNYRIEQTNESIFKMLENKLWEDLLKYDQLINEKGEGRCFLDFEEGPVRFRPTYRYKKGFADLSTEKREGVPRQPAWCDRILWKSVNKNSIRQHEYGGSYTIMSSDHRPVFATFSVDVDVPNVPHKRENCQILITCLKGVNLKAAKEGRKRSPYVVFQSPFLISEVSTPPVADKSLSPQWNDLDIPPLEPISTNKEYLERQWIRIVVRDKEDPSSCLGQGILHLAEATKSEPVPFITKLAYKGRIFGSIEGKVQISWSVNPIKTHKKSSVTIRTEKDLERSNSNSEDIIPVLKRKHLSPSTRTLINSSDKRNTTSPTTSPSPTPRLRTTGVETQPTLLKGVSFQNKITLKQSHSETPDVESVAALVRSDESPSKTYSKLLAKSHSEKKIQGHSRQRSITSWGVENQRPIIDDRSSFVDVEIVDMSE